MIKKPMCLIPARGGSQRIPKKNIVQLLDRPLINWTISTALESHLFDEIWVSSDCEEILSISEKAGARPLVRQAETAGHNATIVDCCLEILSSFDYQKYCYTDLWILLPSSPFRKAKTFKEIWDAYRQSSYLSLLSISSVDYPPEWTLGLSGSGALTKREPHLYEQPRKKLPESYQHDGNHCIANIENFLKEKVFLNENCLGYKSDADEVMDIDTPQDLMLAEFILKNRENI